MLNGGSFYGFYQAIDGRWPSIGSLAPQFSARLLKTLGLSELEKLTMSQKPEYQQELKAAIKQKTSEKHLSHWQEVFAETDSCVEPVLTIRRRSILK